MEQHADGHAEEVLRRSRALGQDAQALAGEVREALGAINRRLDLKGRLERHPYATLAAAAGVGFVLGGGLFTPLTGRVLRLGAKLMLVPLLRNELTALGEMAAEGMLIATRGR